MSSKELKVVLSANVSQFKSAMQSISSEMKSVTSNTKQFATDVGKGLQDVGKKMTLAGVGIVASIGGIVAKGSEWSAQVEGQKFLYNNLDKSIQKTIDSNSKNANSIGLTTQQYKDGATTMATYYKNMGLTAEETSNLSGETMNLVADLGAVVDMPFDEAMSRFKSGLMGNYEALDAFGINLSANTLQNSEYVKSLGKSWNQLSDNEKMMAAYNEILRQSSPMTGLASQEAESFGMKFKLLKQQISETVGEIGTNLLPVLEPLVQKFSEIATKISEWVKENPQLTQTILLVVGAVGMFLTILGPIIMLIGTLTIAVATFNVAMLPVAGTVALVVGAIVGLIAIGGALCSNWDWICEKASELGRIVGEAWNSMCEWISEACSNIGEWISDTWNNIYTWTSDTWNSICDWISNAWNTICNLVTVGVMLIGEILSAGFEIITLPWQFIWENCKNIIIPIWETIKEFISEKLEQIKEFISTVWENIKTVTSTIWEAVKTVISTIWEGIKAVISTIVNWIKENIISRFNEAKNKVTEVVNSMKESISNKFNEIKTNVTNKVNEIKTNITNKFNEAKSKAIEIFTNIKTGIEDKINGAKDVVKKGIDKIKGFFDFEWSLPKLKLPHFSISGGFSLNPPKAPSFKVDWYSKGAIFKKPTVLGGIGVGDSHNGIGSNAEAILPINQLPKLLGLDKMQNNGGVTLSIENFNNNTDKDIEYLANELAFYLSRKKIGLGGAF